MGVLGRDSEATIRVPVDCSGIGLHTGKAVNMRLLPAPPGHGVVFSRVDLPGSPRIAASIENVAGTSRCTSLGRDGVLVMTVEHLLAALWASGITNCEVQLDGEEVPACDGSALVFLELLRHAGKAAQDGTARKAVRLGEPVWIADGRRYIVALPHESFRVSFTFVGEHPGVPTQYADFLVDEEAFSDAIAPARTPAFLWEVEALRKQGLALGGDIESCVLLGESGYVNKPRFPDEVVRHKILDVVGDLALLGGVLAHIVAVGSNHTLNHRLASLIAQSQVLGRE